MNSKISIGVSHLFALHVPKLLVRQGESLRIDDPALYHRIVHVLRLEKGDQLQLFDWHLHAVVTVTSIEKRYLLVHGTMVHDNSVNHSSVTAYLPLLKKDDFEATIYRLVTLGIRSICPLITERSRVWGGEKELARIERIVIAAAEQSKNFSGIMIASPINFAELQTKDDLWYFDCDGIPLKALWEQGSLGNLLAQKSHGVVVGPEGGFSEEENYELKKNCRYHFRFDTPVMKAADALFLAVGIVQSVVMQSKFSFK